jgi:hypothetical protein
MALIILSMAIWIGLQKFRLMEQEEHLEGYRILVLEWYHYLHNKEFSEDFEMWRNELGE